MRVTVRVRPSAGRTVVGGSYNGALIVRVIQATVDGKATASVLRCVAEAFGVSRDDVTLVSGSRSRTKILDVDGATEEQLETLLSI